MSKERSSTLSHPDLVQTKIKAEVVDKIISTELPDKYDNPELFEIIKTQLIHGQC